MNTEVRNLDSFDTSYENDIQLQLRINSLGSTLHFSIYVWWLKRYKYKKTKTYSGRKIPVLGDEVIDQNTAQWGAWEDVFGWLEACGKGGNFFTNLILKEELITLLLVLLLQRW